MDNSTYCWGQGASGQLGNGSTGVSTAPVLVSGGYKWTSVSSGRQMGCGTTNGGSVMCWGQSALGRLGNDNSTGDISVPTAVYLITSSGSSMAVAAVEPTLTFTTTGRATSCNGATVDAEASSGTSMTLGAVNNTARTAAQNLSVSTNAATGYVVYVKRVYWLQSASGRSVSGVPGSNASPAAFPGAGTETWGYTVDDSTLSTGPVDRFTSAGTRWASLSAVDSEIAAAPAPVTAETTCFALRFQTGAITTAGTYTATLSYTAVPQY